MILRTFRVNNRSSNSIGVLLFSMKMKLSDNTFGKK